MARRLWVRNPLPTMSTPSRGSACAHCLSSPTHPVSSSRRGEPCARKTAGIRAEAGASSFSESVASTSASAQGDRLSLISTPPDNGSRSTRSDRAREGERRCVPTCDGGDYDTMAVTSEGIFAVGDSRRLARPRPLTRDPVQCSGTAGCDARRIVGHDACPDPSLRLVFEGRLRAGTDAGDVRILVDGPRGGSFLSLLFLLKTAGQLVLLPLLSRHLLLTLLERRTGSSRPVQFLIRLFRIREPSRCRSEAALPGTQPAAAAAVLPEAWAGGRTLIPEAARVTGVARDSTLGTLARLADADVPPPQLAAVELGDGLLRLLVPAHFDAAEPASAAGEPILDDRGHRTGPRLRQRFLQIVVRRLEGEIAHEQFQAHVALRPDGRWPLPGPSAPERCRTPRSDPPPGS